VSEKAHIPHARAQRLLSGKAKLCESDMENLSKGFKVPMPSPELRAKMAEEAVRYEHAKDFNVHNAAIKREHYKRAKR
jgi:hypothetical protein